MSVGCLSSTYSTLIQQYLHVLCDDNATFYAERLYGHEKTIHSTYLLATCYYQSNQMKRCRSVLIHNMSLTSQCKNSCYLLSKCCYNLGLWVEAEDVLLSGTKIKSKGLEGCRVDLLSEPCPIPNGAAGLYLLGSICRKSNRRKQAETYYRLSLEIDPLLWTSYEALCEMGCQSEGFDAEQVFGVTPDLPPPETEEEEPRYGSPSPYSFRDTVPFISTPNQDSTPVNAKHLFPPSHPTTTRISRYPTTVPNFGTPNLTPIIPDRSIGAGVPNTNPPSVTFLKTSNHPSNSRSIASSRAKNLVASRLYYESSPQSNTNNTFTRERSSKLSFVSTTLQQDVTASSILDSVTSKVGKRALFTDVTKEGTAGAASIERITEKGMNREPPRRVYSENDVNEEKAEKEVDLMEDEGIDEVLNLLYILGTAYKYLCEYKCREALHSLQKLPSTQYQTGWVQHQVGRAYFEMADYTHAQRALENLQTIEPHRVKGLELLSTTYWHLKKEVELCYLAQRVTEFDNTAPESWCIVGNCFSLQKEHETALKFFRRSLQLDPSFTYSHTLSGHEYVSNEDFDKAVACFRNAIRFDERHYNAWYGLGTIYFRQEKYDLSEYHFRRALSINPQSSVLHCYLGMVLNANGKHYEALKTLDTVLDVRTHGASNPQARFQRSNILLSLGRCEEALTELEKVRDSAPHEASVHFTMGKVCKKLGNVKKAMRCFLTALDLDPKNSNLYQSAIDRLDEPDIDEDVSTF